MAPSITTTVHLRVAPGTVWKTWCALPRWPQWQPETVEVRWLAGESRWQAGSRFEMRRRTPYGLLDRLAGANTRRFTGRVLSVAEDQLLVWELVPRRAAWFGPTLVQSVRLAPAPGGTNVALSLSAHGLGPTLLSPLVSRGLHGQATATLAALQRHLAPLERRQ